MALLSMTFVFLVIILMQATNADNWLKCDQWNFSQVQTAYKYFSYTWSMNGVIIDKAQFRFLLLKTVKMHAVKKFTKLSISIEHTSKLILIDFFNLPTFYETREINLYDFLVENSLFKEKSFAEAVDRSLFESIFCWGLFDWSQKSYKPKWKRLF